MVLSLLLIRSPSSYTAKKTKQNLSRILMLNKRQWGAPSSPQERPAAVVRGLTLSQALVYGPGGKEPLSVRVDAE